MTRWRRFRQLAPDEQRLLLAAALLLPLVGAMLRVLGFARCQAVVAALARPRAGSPSASESLDRARSAARLVRAAAERGCYRATCLPQSLLLWLLLRRRGADAVLRVGVRKADDRLQAHAWVEYRGVVVNDDPDVHEQFTAFDRVSAG